MKKILPAIIILFSIHVFATPSIDWMKMPNMLANSGTALALDSVNNVYTTTSTGSIVLEKRDRFGNFQWQVVSSTTLPLNYEFPAQVWVDPQGNPIVVGYRHTHSSDGNNANALIILKYNPSGQLLFKKTIDGTFSFFNNSRYWTNVSSQLDIQGNIFIGVAGNVVGHVDWGFNVLKLSTQGIIIHVSTKNFPSSTNFHYITKLRLTNNIVGVTGVTSYSSANASTWILDTAGTSLWDNISNGVQGKDLLFDSFGNTFVLTWVSISLMGDVTVYKFDPAGNLIWNHNYDFGGSDLSGRMEFTPDNNIAIMAYGNNAPGISYYTDWLTFKIDTAGIMLWSDRYDEHTSNDEVPGAMAVDGLGNIYITGIGGPFPGGSNLGKRQMVTVKYTPSGIRDWTSTIDTISEYMTGTAIRIGVDSSIFVMGDVNTFTVHYFDHTGTSPCSAPLNITSTVLTNDSVIINWAVVPNAYLYHVEYKTATSATWIRLSTDSNSISIANLYAGTVYDFHVEALCNSGPTGFSPTQQFTTTGNGYCNSFGLDASKEWIDLVFIETLLNSSGNDSGYADFTNQSAILTPGNTYDITLSADMLGGPYTESWKVWIDFNQDGDFIDPGEEVVSYSSSQIGWETHSITIPGTVANGSTRMRVSLKNGNNQGPCDTISLGEVEDYTITFSGINAASQVKNNSGIILYPNPGTNNLIISGAYKSEINVIDLQGRILLNLKAVSNEFSIDAYNLSAGTYLVHVTSENGSINTFRWTKN